MNHRRLVGIDLGITSAHTVRILDGEGATIAKRNLSSMLRHVPMTPSV